jgi:hypothetical protein
MANIENKRILDTKSKNNINKLNKKENLFVIKKHKPRIMSAQVAQVGL